MSYNFLNQGDSFHGVFATNFKIWPSSRLRKSWRPSLSSLNVFLVCRGVTGMESFIRRQKRTWEHHTFEKGDFLGYFPEPKSKCSQRLRAFISYCHCSKFVPPCFIYFVNSPSEFCIYTENALFYTRNCFLSAEVAVPVLLQCHLGKKFCNQVALASIPIFIGSSPFTTGQLSQSWSSEATSFNCPPPPGSVLLQAPYQQPLQSVLHWCVAAGATAWRQIGQALPFKIPLAEPSTPPKKKIVERGGLGYT